MKLSILVPAYNEENRIKKTLLEYNSFLQKNYDDYEIIVICDGCYDQTPTIVHATGDIIGFTDADGATPPTSYNKLIDATIKDTDIAIGSRKIKGAKITTHQSKDRELASKAFNLLVNIIFKLNIKDTQCGAKVFKKEVIKKILPSLTTKGFETDVELIWRAKKENYRLKEIPITWEHKGGETFNFKYIPNMFINLIKLKIKT